MALSEQNADLASSENLESLVTSVSHRQCD